ncbi:ABC transporter permease [Amycolatopsis magusensis]|uniref:ABC-type uncharacterized transport system permease subunit n=1 Tax=Amycolatopsis magusensis TaxID=882444 RepID=A0ABS4PVK3_9PSEU|nr:ABC-2 family transporter protein [Amycolatopsis magusensis]MBP2182930.1 ABC-type uncharacterized transport system permease subunit [Amycolatopsis magusensis]
MQVRTVLTYRLNYLISVIGVIMHIYLLNVVWSAVYEGRGAVEGVPLETVMVYSTFAAVQNWLLVPWEFSLIPARVREGQVAFDLVRPIGFVGQVVAGQFGRTLAVLPLAVALLPLAVVVGRSQSPASPAAGVWYVAGLLGAWIVATQLSIVVGMLAFWTLEVSGWFLVYRMVSLFLSGALVPLWFMPPALRVLAEVLPFQAITYGPVAVYLGREDGLGVIGVQLLWIALLAVLSRWIWVRALHRVVVQGG